MAETNAMHSIELVSKFAGISPSELSLLDRINVLQECVKGIAGQSTRWAGLAAQEKGSDAYYAGDLLTGPAIVLRQLQLTISTLRNVLKYGKPILPGRPIHTVTGRLSVPVFPTRDFNDRLLFPGISASVRFPKGCDEEAIHAPQLREILSTSQRTEITAILGAGNVSSIPATDTLNKIFFEGQRVVLKMNPVNDYLTDVFERALAPLIDSKLLMIVRGGAEVGSALVHHPDVRRVHITGSDQAHDAIVWGSTETEREKRKIQNRPILNKPITSELGNVSPWIVVPGVYSQRELNSQAKHIANSITNNASFNCLATKVIITCRAWPQRRIFLDKIQACLRTTPLRPSYYPGARERYIQFSGREPPTDSERNLPWLLLEDQSIEKSPALFTQESFVCICAETQLAGASSEDFLRQAAAFANEQMTGTLCASITAPRSFRSLHAETLEHCIDALRYGTVCINQWAGLSYALITTPWGAYPGSTLSNPESGIGSVHNTFLLNGFEKTVLTGPLVDLLKPAWFAEHRQARSVAERLVAYYASPTVGRLVCLGLSAVRG